jgi:hypothetical protein
MTGQPSESTKERGPAAIDSELASDMEAVRTFAPSEPVEPEALASLRRRIDRSLATETGARAALMALGVKTQLALVLFAMLVIGIAIALAAPRHDMSEYPRVRLIVVLALFGGLAGGCVWGALWPLHRPAASRFRRAVMLACAVVAPALISFFPHAEAGQAPLSGIAFASRSGTCLATGFALSLPFLILAALVRRSDVDGPIVAALAGAAAGLLGNGALELHCPVGDSAHLLVGHAILLPLCLVALVAWQAMTARSKRRLTRQRSPRAR